jgi:tRNA (cytidine/uridine-2'-O-)-methyltransferase
VKPQRWPDWPAFEAELPRLGEPFFFSPEATRDLWSITFPKRCVLVFGRESVGLPASLRARFESRLFSLPMLDPELRSLNLSTCVGVALYEVLRQARASPDR